MNVSSLLNRLVSLCLCLILFCLILLPHKGYASEIGIKMSRMDISSPALRLQSQSLKINLLNFQNFVPSSLAVIVRSLGHLLGTERDISWGNGQSRRFLIEKDGMGYTVTDTIVDEGSESFLQYQNHLETCYCIEGKGEIETMDGKIYSLAPGTIYALDQHDRHFLRAEETMRLVCMFTPALVGDEVHDLTGTGESSY